MGGSSQDGAPGKPPGPSQETRRSPSRESLREVKAEAKDRQRARQAGFVDVESFHAHRSRRSRARRRRLRILLTVCAAGGLITAGGLWFSQSSTLNNMPWFSSGSDAAPTPTAETFDAVAEARTLMNKGPWRRWKPEMTGLTVKPAQAQEELGLSQADAQKALNASLVYIKAALFDHAVLYDGDVQTVLRTLGGNDRRLSRAMSDTNPLTPAASAYMTRFRPSLISSAGVRPRATGLVQDVVTYRVIPGVSAQAAFKVTFEAKVAYPIVVGTETDQVFVVVVARRGEVIFQPGHFDKPYWESGSWVSSAGQCGPLQSVESEFVAATPVGLLPKHKDHCYG